MNAFVDFLREIAFLTCETAPYLLVGFFLAGLIKVYVSGKAIYGNLGGNDLRSVLRASLYGIPLPLCSCSVIPTATSLKRSGASKGATASFLIATPETGVDSISVTYALLDPIMTVVRPVVALITAVATGSAVSLMVRRGWDSEDTGELSAAKDGCHDHGHDDVPAAESPVPPVDRLRAALRYAFGPLLDDLTPWLLIGFTISALISLLTPADLFVDTVPRGLPSMLLMLLLATPIYICATASTPIAAVLIAKGLDPGAALVFLLVGPATNITTLLVVSKLLGKKTLAIYLTCITGVALLAGWLVGEAYTLLRLDLAAVVTQSLSREPGWLAAATGVVFALLLLRSSIRLDLWRGWRRRLGITALLVLWASTSLTVLAPGEYGWVMRFGGVVRTLDRPGPYLHWPYPVERPEIVAAEQIRSLPLGFDAAPEGERKWRPRALERELEDQAEVMAGDGTLLRITYSVHYRCRDAYRMRFAIDDPQILTRAFAEAAVRQIVARRPSATWLVDERLEIARRTAERLTAELDAIDSGIEVTSVNVRDVHAPTDVHAEYRDVASALEDRERLLHEAQGERARTVAAARSTAYQQEQGAVAARDEAIQRARATAARFLKTLAAYRPHADATRHRLRLEALERALTDARIFALLGADVQLELLDLAGQQDASSAAERARSLIPERKE